MNETNEKNTRGEKGISGNTDGNASRNQQYIYWCFTFYHETINEVEMLRNILLHECDWFVMQEEIGNKENKKHIQGTLKLKKRQRLTQLKHWDQSIHWESTRRIDKSLLYCQKSDTATGRMWAHGIDTTRGQLKDPMDGLAEYTWQKKIKAIIKEEPDPRKIYWVWSEQGKVGKTMFFKHLCIHNSDIILVDGESKDIFYSIAEIKPRVVFFNLTRSEGNDISYKAIETIKDGMFFNRKWKSSMVLFNPPHLFIISNTSPNLSKLSEDRWMVMKVDQNGFQLSGAPLN